MYRAVCACVCARVRVSTHTCVCVRVRVCAHACVCVYVRVATSAKTKTPCFCSAHTQEAGGTPPPRMPELEMPADKASLTLATGRGSVPKESTPVTNSGKRRPRQRCGVV